MAAALRERSALLLTEGRSGAPRDALGVRNRLLTLLLDRTGSYRDAPGVLPDAAERVVLTRADGYGSERASAMRARDC